MESGLGPALAHELILKVRKEVDAFIQKDKTMSIKGKKVYDYVSIDNMIKHVRAVMDKHGLDVHMDEIKFDAQERKKWNKQAGRETPYILGIVSFKACFICVHEGQLSVSLPETFTQPGIIANEQDAGAIQAYALKYLFRRKFLLETGEGDKDNTVNQFDPTPPQQNTYQPVGADQQLEQHKNTIRTQLIERGFTEDYDGVAAWIISPFVDAPSEIKYINVTHAATVLKWLRLTDGVMDLPKLVRPAIRENTPVKDWLVRAGLLPDDHNPPPDEAAKPVPEPVQPAAPAEPPKTEAEAKPQTVPERRAFVADWMKEKGLKVPRERNEFVAWVCGNDGLTVSRMTAHNLSEFEMVMEMVDNSDTGWRLDRVMLSVTKNNVTISEWLATLNQTDTETEA